MGFLTGMLALAAALGAAGPEAFGGNPSSVPAQLTAAGNALYFTADDATHGRELWKWECPGLAYLEQPPNVRDVVRQGQTRLVADLTPGIEDTRIDYIVSCHDILYFYAHLRQCGREPCFYDAVQDSVHTWDIRPGPETSDASNPFPVRNRTVVVVADDGVHGMQLWAAPAGSPSPVPLSFQAPLPPSARILGHLTPEGFLYVVDGHGLACTDGAEVTKAVRWENLDVVALELWDLGNRVLFLGSMNGLGNELWITDDSPEGARLVKDIAPGPATSGPEGGFRWGDCLYFKANDGEHGNEPYKTDGSTEGTVLLQDINRGLQGSNPHYWKAAGDLLFFVADDGVHGYEIWQTAGSPDTTLLTTDLRPGGTGSDPWSLEEYRGNLFFCANSPEYGEEIFITDGTPQGTRILKDVVLGPDGSGPDNLTVFGDFLFFTCDDRMHGEELWISDGTPEGTLLAADIATARVNPSASPRQFTPVDGLLLFTANDFEHGEELWVSDGSEPGTNLLRDVAPGPADAAPRFLTRQGGRVFFSAFSPDLGRELWTSHGSIDGTQLVNDIYVGGGSSEPRDLTVWNQALLFTANDGVHGRELWRTDGLPDSTRMVLDAAPGGAGTEFAGLFVLRGKAYFYTGKPPSQMTLWSTDGTDSGTSPLLRFDCTYFMDFPEDVREPVNPAADLTLLRTGVSEEDLLVPLLRPWTLTNPAAAPVTLGDVTYFSAHTRRYGTELCMTNGTRAGTHMVRDAFTGPGSSSPSYLTVLEGKVYFAADHPREGRVLWRTDGTSEGTNFLTPLFGDRLSSPIPVATMVSNQEVMLVFGASPEQTDLGNNLLNVIVPKTGQDHRWAVSPLLKAGSRPTGNIAVTKTSLYIAFDDGIHGEELWAYARDAPEDRPTHQMYLVRDILTNGYASRAAP